MITTDTGDLHIIVERIARHIRDEATLQQAVEALQTVYNWPSWIDGIFACRIPASRPFKLVTASAACLSGPTRCLGLSDIKLWPPWVGQAPLNRGPPSGSELVAVRAKVLRPSPG